MYKLMSERVPDLVIAESDRLKDILFAPIKIDHDDNVYDYILHYGGEIHNDNGKLKNTSNIKLGTVLLSVDFLELQIYNDHQLFIIDFKTHSHYRTFDLGEAIEVFDKLCTFYCKVYNQ